MRSDQTGTKKRKRARKGFSLIFLPDLKIIKKNKYYKSLFSKESHHFTFNNLQRLHNTFFGCRYIFLICTNFTQQSQGLGLLYSTMQFINSLLHYHLYLFRF